MLTDCNYSVTLAHCFTSETASCHMTQTGKFYTAAHKLPLGGAKQLTGPEQSCCGLPVKTTEISIVFLIYSPGAGL